MHEAWKTVRSEQGEHRLELGSYFAFQALHTPRHLVFTFARYKHAAKFLPLQTKSDVLELGCTEGLGTLILAEGGNRVVGVDFDKDAVEHAQRSLKETGVTFLHDDFLGKRYGEFDAVISLDVVEHVEPTDEDKYFETIRDNLRQDGICVVGTPNQTSSQYASRLSEIGHINLYTAERLYRSMTRYFRNVFIFGMNDEVLHTGFYPMCHYLMALGCGVKRPD
ncbi:MAG: class I SAM-dependent methyltransferase [Candidatus Poribacteria bacterium]|nr:class I SAM-dependent methyltransferase [Candidatus Poribacteria bacterium]